MTALRVLAVDDEQPALEDLAYLLRADPRIGDVATARDGASALKILDRAMADGRPIEAVFLDIRMRGLDGVVLGRLLTQFARPPRVVFVTAYEDHAVDAFEIKAEDYLLKPVRPERLAEAIRRVCAAVPDAAPGLPQDDPARAVPDADTIPVELAGVTRFVASSDVRFVEAQGDYARLHTPTGSHLVRIPLAALEERWAGAGFVRVHRSHLVAVKHIDELHIDSGRCTVRIGETEIPVSRRHTRELRDLLVRRARKGRPE
ncbi:DNA-binding response regulator [Sphaerisporangium krabiense]|uniref:DNA-binding LytR/AlgR family response regulator n=1 Tax=Sphaerisporangium krabiense TaxID=763782 RepID=A0A7W8ZAZ3_9ACTN|nr:LytTR family DNA-binding domain-containing protein [Sphaerisporangium krabiense]MBB5630662.1 DNA-binding LytR/AlgR family response regulator [Sphaerisporangium krabiense]GII62381.1 DNA-binding response regulator [Sphaerisporangium krabiense]